MVMPWYNPTIYTEDVFIGDQGVQDTLFAMYQHQVASTSLLFAGLILYAAFRFLKWFLPSYYHKRRVRQEGEE